jgi:hypothetical protein
MTTNNANIAKSWFPWFLTTEERTKSTMVAKYRSTTPIILEKIISDILRTLFITTEVKLYLPYWDKSNTGSTPDVWYYIRYATKASRSPLFVEPYNPMMVKKYTNNSKGEIKSEECAIIYAGHLFALSTIPHLLDLMSKMAEWDSDFFEVCGKRWGRCLMCNKELKVEKSLERSMGPVCFSRLEKVNTYDASEPHEEREEEIIPVALDIMETFLNTVEAKTIDTFNDILDAFAKQGLRIDTTSGAPKLSLGLVYHGRVDLQLTASGKGLWVTIVDGGNDAIDTLGSLGGKIALRSNSNTTSHLFPSNLETAIRNRFKIGTVHPQEEEPVNAGHTRLNITISPNGQDSFLVKGETDTIQDILIRCSGKVINNHWTIPTEKHNLLVSSLITYENNVSNLPLSKPVSEAKLIPVEKKESPKKKEVIYGPDENGFFIVSGNTYIIRSFIKAQGGIFQPKDKSWKVPSKNREALIASITKA